MSGMDSRRFNGTDTEKGKEFAVRKPALAAVEGFGCGAEMVPNSLCKIALASVRLSYVKDLTIVKMEQVNACASWKLALIHIDE